MPIIYLSPSTQEGNMYVNGGSEEYYMNLIADAMLPYLRSSGIRYTRNLPEMTAADSIEMSNAGNYALHLALHSNAAPDGRYGQIQGIDVYYSPRSSQGKRAAQIFAQNLKSIYPRPSLVRIVPTVSVGEVRLTRAPAVFLEMGYHDNEDDAKWIKENIQKIAANIVLSLTQYFGIPFVEPAEPRAAEVSLSGGNLNLREKPALNARVIGSMPNGSFLTVLGQWRDWYVVNWRGIVGYALSRYINIR